MANQPRSQLELYNIFKNEVQVVKPELTDFEEGAINDSLAGATSVSASELVDLILLKYAKTFIDSSNGPEVTGGDDDLQTLAVDHYGDDFTRPDATNAQGVVQFTRPSITPGDVTIPAGTVVKTSPDANGASISFATVISVTMTGLSINASVEAVEAGTTGNVEANTVVVIESALTDGSVVVDNSSPMAGGEAAEDDATYRETIKRKITQLAGATCAALEAKLEEVPGIEQATVSEFAQTVIEYDTGSSSTVGASFTIPRVKAFIADANGSANQALIDTADETLKDARGCGIRVDVFAAVSISLDWSATIVLNPAGPNFATFQTDTTLITDSMTKYVQDLDIGADFVRSAADQAILAIWGSTGTGDLIAAGFNTVSPAGDISTADNERLTPNIIETV